jgi:hypothetical protein
MEIWNTPHPVSSSQLRCLSLDAYVVDCKSWNIPNLAFLIITRRKERMDDSWIIFLQKVGKTLLRLEMINNATLPWILDTRFLRWCTQLHTLALDLLRFSILPGSVSECLSIKRLVLVVRREDDPRDLVAKILLALHSMSAWINECLTHLLEVTLSVPCGFSSGRMELHVPYEGVVKVAADRPVRIAYY